MLFGDATSPRVEIVHEAVMGKINGTAASGKIRSGSWNLYVGNPGYGAYPQPGQGKSPKDPTPRACDDKPCLFNVTSDAAEKYDVADQFPDIVADLQRRLGEAAWQCLDGLCTTDTYTGKATACDSLKVYGAFGPWAPLAPAPTPSTTVVRFKQISGVTTWCLSFKTLKYDTDNHAAHGVSTLGPLQLADCTDPTTLWSDSDTFNDKPAIRSKDPSLHNKEKYCIHINFAEKNQTCKDTPAENHPELQTCAHGNAFRYLNSTQQLVNANCPSNWPNTCLVSAGNTSGATVVVAACSATRDAVWMREVVQPV
eukprot:m.167703 g.167703  ORF g.167703 m.167703 type:complete len:311 (-) comp18195_c0_seq21:809-1741(-)